MEHPESIQDFYTRYSGGGLKPISLNNAGLGHFNVFRRDNCSLVTNYSRRDYYKVAFIIGTGTVHFANQWIYIDQPALLFSNPLVPYSWEADSAEQKGWFCLFTEDFIRHDEKTVSLQDSPLFRIGASPVYFLDKTQQKEVAGIFEKMEQEMVSDYPHKFSVQRNYLHLIIHQAMKCSTEAKFEKSINAGTRITNLFLELLERQFPIDSPELVLNLRTPQHYAHHLSVHVNHLNRSVKQTTGRTTSAHITSRVVKEANALLLHSDWNIAEIAYSLGFEYPAHFTNFYKKHTGQSPVTLRKELV